jgi:hypothetical protein
MPITGLDKEHCPRLQLRLVAIDRRRTAAINNVELLVRPLMLVVGATFSTSGGEHHDGCLGSRIGDRKPEARTESELIVLHGISQSRFDFFFGTFLPLRRASESPMAIACLRLFTFLPLPLFRVPRLRLRIAPLTSRDALFE